MLSECLGLATDTVEGCSLNSQRGKTSMAEALLILPLSCLLLMVKSHGGEYSPGRGSCAEAGASRLLMLSVKKGQAMARTAAVVVAAVPPDPAHRAVRLRLGNSSKSVGGTLGGRAGEGKAFRSVILPQSPPSIFPISTFKTKHIYCLVATD